MKNYLVLLFLLFAYLTSSATGIKGKILSKGEPVPYVNIRISNTDFGTSSDINGIFEFNNLEKESYTLEFSSIGFYPFQQKITLGEKQETLNIELTPSAETFQEMVITGTMKEMSLLESPVPVEVYTPSYFKKNPTPALFESLQLVNGIRPQLNCNVCNTGDIHINGMEGPYTMVLIDGMPVVGGLSSVYGLNGIPQSLIERIEVIKGPASTLYGSEAVGGIINVITKSPENSAAFAVDAFLTSWQELNTDIGIKTQNKKLSNLTGINYFNYNNPLDKNDDNFTDVTLQKRVSIFNKTSFKRADKKEKIGRAHV